MNNPLEKLFVMSKIISRITKRFIITFFISQLSFSVFAANKIVLIGSENMHKGLLSSFDLEHIPSNLSYTLPNNYIIEVKNNTAPLDEISQQEDVLAIVCQTSNECVLALKDSAAKDLLVISATASSRLLGDAENIWRMAPSNALQAKAIYHEIKTKTAQEPIAIIYEPKDYGLDLYASMMEEVFFNTILENDGPKLAGAIPLHTNINLNETQKSITADKAIAVLQDFAKMNVKSVAYFGYRDGFNALTDETIGGNPNVVDHWYVGDGVPIQAGEKPTNLSVFKPYYPNTAGETNTPAYYYAHDAGTLLSKTIAKMETTTDPDRTLFLETAKTLELSDEETQTGKKTFNTADEHGVFNVDVYDSLGNLQTKKITFTR